MWAIDSVPYEIPNKDLARERVHLVKEGYLNAATAAYGYISGNAQRSFKEMVYAIVLAPDGIREGIANAMAHHAWMKFAAREICEHAADIAASPYWTAEAQKKAVQNPNSKLPPSRPAAPTHDSFSLSGSASESDM